MLLSPPTVLIVDDDASIRMLVQELLEDEGYSVVSASNGAAGLACIEAGSLGLALVDAKLPDMSGQQLCQQVRATEQDSHLPIILFTGMLGDVKGYALAACADDYLTKPFDIDEMLSKVRTWVRADSAGSILAELAGSVR